MFIVVCSGLGLLQMAIMRCKDMAIFLLFGIFSLRAVQHHCIYFFTCLKSISGSISPMWKSYQRIIGSLSPMRKYLQNETKFYVSYPSHFLISIVVQCTRPQLMTDRFLGHCQ